MNSARNDKGQALRIINSLAPTRICDNGGWTDTWFARHGKVFNIGVAPQAEVQIEVFRREEREQPVTLHAENFGDCYALPSERSDWGRHPLLEAAIERVGVPPGAAVQVNVFSEAPSGASTGTSASVAVALIGALDRLNGGRLAPHAVAYLAHSVEVDMLHLQCGIQDQLCAAYGGVNYIDMYDYPHATVSQLQLPSGLLWELEQRLVLIYLGRAHQSSAIHEKVIRELENAGPDCRQLEDLRGTAEQAQAALAAGDLAGLGRSMIENTAAQVRLHPDLVCPDAERVIAVAREHGALGWKVNGAGGEGGSITLLCGPQAHARRAMVREIEAESPLFRHIPIALSATGLRVWESA